MADQSIVLRRWTTDFQTKLSQIGKEANDEIAMLSFENLSLINENALLKQRIKELEGGNTNWDIRKAHREMLGKMQGFAKAHGVSGGDSGVITVVDSIGELRRFASDSTNRIIVFDKSVDGDRWTIRDPDDEIKPGRNKTIWGITRDGEPIDIEIRADWRGEGAAVRLNKENVVIAGLTMSWGDRGRYDNAPDLIAAYSPGGAWIYNNKFNGTGREDREDGVFDVYSPGCTFQLNVVKKCWKCHLVRRQGELTIWNCRYDDCGGRFPHVGDEGVAHTNRSIIRGSWKYLMLASEKGRLLVTNSNLDGGLKGVEIRKNGRWGDAGRTNTFDGLTNDPKTSHGFDVPYDF